MYQRDMGDINRIIKKRENRDKSMIYTIGISDFDFNLIIDKKIREEIREEAKEIIRHWLDRMRKSDSIPMHSAMVELVVYHLEDSVVFTAHLDYMKWRLIEWGLMEDDGEFGKRFTNGK